MLVILVSMVSFVKWSARGLIACGVLYFLYWLVIEVGMFLRYS